MNDYKYEQRVHKRGDYCIFVVGNNGYKCGCGARGESEKKYRKKQVRARLKNKLRKDVDNM